MKIALVGYGKMGKAIEQIAMDFNGEIVLRINSENRLEDHLEALQDIDVAIEFSTPSAAFTNLKLLIEHGVDVVCGSTAWLDRWDEIVALNKQYQTAFFYASNFSLGVNLFFELNKKLAQMMEKHLDSYEVSMQEIHHTTKLDAPSGTAITLAEQIIESTSISQWINKPTDSEDTLGIESLREDKVPGTHSIKYQSNVDELSIQHIAYSRTGFAKGALMAAQWVKGKKGIFGMTDMLNF